MDIAPDTLRASKNAHEMLWVFDFQIHDDVSEPYWFDTAPLAPFEAVGRRGSGCVYALFRAQQHVLLVTSEGDAAVIAATLREALELVVAYPYWEVMVRGSAGDLTAMRRIFREERAEYEEGLLDDHPEAEEYRRVLTAEFGLAEPSDPAGLVHRAITQLGANVLVRGLDGTPCAPLFGRYRTG